MPTVGGDAALARGVVETGDGAYEVGAPSDAQLAKWAEAAPAAPPAAAAAALAAPLPAWQGAVAAALPAAAVGAAAVALGVLTHHLQIEVFVI